MSIRELILNSAPPLEWVGQEDHPIHQLGYYYFGISDGFRFDKNAVLNADDALLKKIYGEIARYWCGQNICVDKYEDYTHL